MAHVGAPALYPIKRGRKGGSKADNLGVLEKKQQQFSFVSTPHVCGAFPTTSNSAALAGVLHLT